MTDLLAGVRVLETAPLLPGASVGMLLADLGADVVKVEPPQGDLIRWALGQVAPGYSPAHLQLNRGKRSVVADLRTEPGRYSMRALVRSADVLIDGNAPGMLRRNSFDAEQLNTLNPTLVLCQVSGYGADGPYAQIPAYGLQVSAVAGALAAAVPDADEVEGASVSGRGGDTAAAVGVHAALCVAAALVRRSRSNVGAVIDAAGADALLAHSMIPVIYAANRHRLLDTSTLPALAEGTAGPRYQVYKTSDGLFVAFAALAPQPWQRFCDAVNRPDLAPAGPTDTSLTTHLTPIFGGRSRTEWMDLARSRRLPIAPVHVRADEIAGDSQLQHRQTFIETVHPVAGPFTCIGIPAIIDGTPRPIPRPAPAIGEHTDDFTDGWVDGP